MPPTLSAKLKELRLGAGLTQKSLGEALQLSNLYKSPPSKIVGDYESGLRTPKEEVISRYANYFMLHPRHLKALRQKSIAQQEEKKLKGCKTELSRILKKARLDAGLTMQETAVKLRLGDFYPPIAKNPGAVKARMSFWETGRKRPTAEVLQRYTDTFRVSIPAEISVNGAKASHEVTSSDDFLVTSHSEDETQVVPPQPSAISRRNGRELQSSKTIYYRCTQRDRYGLPTEIERSHYDENNELIRVEKQEVFA